MELKGLVVQSNSQGWEFRDKSFLSTTTDLINPQKGKFKAENHCLSLDCYAKWLLERHFTSIRRG